jgi:hypothetical protein
MESSLGTRSFPFPLILEQTLYLTVEKLRQLIETWYATSVSFPHIFHILVQINKPSLPTYFSKPCLLPI